MVFIGKSIKRFRSQRGLRQQELAEAAQLTPSFLSLVENDRRVPSLVVLRRIAKALDVPEEVLLWDSVAIPDGLSETDRQLCEAAKLIVRRFHESAHDSDVTTQTRRRELDRH